MFQFCTFAPHPLYIQGWVPLRVGCPIRTPQDLSSFTSSPGLFAGYHVLHRLLTPRHPPCALMAVAPTGRRGLLRLPIRPFRVSSLGLAPRTTVGPNDLAHFQVLNQPIGTRCLSCNCCICNTRPRDPLESHAAALHPSRIARGRSLRNDREPPAPDGADVNTYPVVKEAAGRWDLPASRHPCRFGFGDQGLMRPVSRRGSLGGTPPRSSNRQTF